MKKGKRAKPDAKVVAAERILRAAPAVNEGIEKEYRLLEDLVKLHEKFKQAAADRTSQLVETTRAILAVRPADSPEAQLLGGALGGLRRTSMSLNHWSFRKTVEELRRALDEAAGHLARLREMKR